MGHSACAFTPLGFEGVSRRGLPAKAQREGVLGSRDGRPCGRKSAGVRFDVASPGRVGGCGVPDPCNPRRAGVLYVVSPLIVHDPARTGHRRDVTAALAVFCVWLECSRGGGARACELA